MLAYFVRLMLHTAAVSLLFCSLSASAGGNPIIIGQAIDLSGPNASIGRDYVAGIRTYFDMINAGGGIDGRLIQYLVRDDRGEPRLSAKLCMELIERDQVEYLFGGIGDDVVQAVVHSPAFRNSGHILFAPLATASRDDGARIMFWRPSYQQEIGHVLSHFGKLGMQRVAIAYQESSSTAEAYRGLLNELKIHQVKLTGTARIGADAADMAREADRLARTKPEVVLLMADTIGTALFLKEYRKHDAQTFVAGTSLINLATLRELAGAQAVEWTVFAQVVPDPVAGTSLLQIEHLNMMRKYRDETVSSLTLEGFAAAKALAKSMQHAKAPGRALQEFSNRHAAIDLGGLTIMPSGNGSHLSNYLDIALFKKGSGLRF